MNFKSRAWTGRLLAVAIAAVAVVVVNAQKDQRKEPLPAYWFSVEIAGTTYPFRSVSGLKIETDVVEALIFAEPGESVARVQNPFRRDDPDVVQRGPAMGSLARAAAHGAAGHELVECAVEVRLRIAEKHPVSGAPVLIDLEHGLVQHLVLGRGDGEVLLAVGGAAGVW